MSARRHKPERSNRPPRIRVPNNEQAVFTLDNRKLVGVIKRLSLTGGSVVLTAKQPAPQGSLGEMCLNTIYGKVTAQVEFLHTGADGIPHAQAFRFLDMDDLSRQRFTSAAEQMRLAGFSDAEKPSSLGWAVNGLGRLTEGVRRMVRVSSKKP